jgi:hypothetical protein
VRDPAQEGPSLTEALAVWAMFAAVAITIAVTYALLSPAELYNTSVDGVRGGLGRALVFLNFPTALAALALVAIPVDRLDGRLYDALGLLAVALCLVVGVPGVVEAGDLDAKPANAVPALGVGIALALALVALVRTGRGRAPGRVGGDRLRLVLAIVLVLAAIPWILADVGVYADDVPGLGLVFMASAVVPEPGHPDIRAVHLGHHHGLDGVLFALAALALSRELARMRRPYLRLALAAWLSLMLVYGLANALEDFWLEQVWKRGTTSFRFPAMLRPDLGPEWLGFVLAAAAVYALLTRPTLRLRPRRA